MGADNKITPHATGPQTTGPHITGQAPMQPQQAAPKIQQTADPNRRQAGDQPATEQVTAGKPDQK